MRRSHFMTGSTRKTTHTADPGSTIAARPDPQHRDKIGTVSVEPNPNNENGSTLFKRNTVQKTGRGTPGREQERLNRLEQAIGERFSYWEFTTRRVLLLGLFAEMAAIMVQPSSVCVRPSTAPLAL